MSVREARESVHQPHQTCYRLSVPVGNLSCSQGERTARCLCAQQHSARCSHLNGIPQGGSCAMHLVLLVLVQPHTAAVH